MQISQEADQVVWYSHLFQNFPQFIVIRTVKGFGIVKRIHIQATGWQNIFAKDTTDIVVVKLLVMPYSQ